MTPGGEPGDFGRQSIKFIVFERPLFGPRIYRRSMSTKLCCKEAQLFVLLRTVPPLIL